MSTYEPPSLSKIFSGTTTHFSRVYVDIEEGISVDILDLVCPWLQFSAFENGRTVIGRVESHAHGQQSKYGKSWERNNSRCEHPATLSFVGVRHSGHHNQSTSQKVSTRGGMRNYQRFPYTLVLKLVSCTFD